MDQRTETARKVIPVAGALALAGAIAVAIGTVAQIVMLGLGGAGQGGVIVIFDWLLAPVWGFAFVILGKWVAGRYLRAGRFGPGSSALSGSALVAGVSLAFFAAMGLPPAPELYEPLLYAAHLGIVYGSLAGFLFWRIMTGRDAALLPPGRLHFRRNATRAYATAFCLYGAAIALLSLALF
jgi:hypothetical protein